ncbi:MULTISPECIES: hypothetical protein [unclassified Arenibacter]|jgi:hypothetical protein|uniref:hypothetical protein n=1 Tax=unclassified Arenibacter TaxID=2615047 RepID=UPI000E345263|nr:MULTISPECIES: hypothetical protein [unclassified Arenibacter]MCM4164500.1 hypothetical protein [Arenibacter sp. A80]RFT55588.1 hypothetical protein D0S24_12920 [Arenibacter sp. P308M17]
MEHIEKNKELQFVKNGPWPELYVLTEHWKSDLEFYADDLRFLHHLVDKYFMWITKPENLDMVKELKVGLFHLKNKCHDLLEKVQRHRIQLGEMVADYNKSDANLIRTEHEHLEEEVAKFVTLFRSNRKEVFAITEFIIDSEKLVNLMDNR